jgi:hypothetical protein
LPNRYWPVRRRHASDSSAWGKHVVPSGHSIVTGQTATCKARAAALLRAGGLVNFPEPFADARWENFAPGPCILRPIGRSASCMPKGKDNGGNDRKERTDG